METIKEKELSSLENVQHVFLKSMKVGEVYVKERQEDHIHYLFYLNALTLLEHNKMFRYLRGKCHEATPLVNSTYASKGWNMSCAGNTV